MFRRSELSEISLGVATGCITATDSRKRDLAGGLFTNEVDSSITGDGGKSTKQANKKGYYVL